MKFIEGLADEAANVKFIEGLADEADEVECEKGDGLESEKVQNVDPVDGGVQDYNRHVVQTNDVASEDVHVDVGVQDENVVVGVVDKGHAVQTRDVDGYVADQDLLYDVPIQDVVAEKGHSVETRDVDGGRVLHGHDEEPVDSFNVEQSSWPQVLQQENHIQVASNISLHDLFQEVDSLKTRLQLIEKRECCHVSPVVVAEFDVLRKRLLEIESILNIKSKFEVVPHQSNVHSKDSVATDDKCHDKAIVSHLAPQSHACSKESDVKGNSDSDYYDSMVSIQLYMVMLFIIMQCNGKYHNLFIFSPVVYMLFKCRPQFHIQTVIRMMGNFYASQ